jgi:IclR family acetate operon transcriptional repressor
MFSSDIHHLGYARDEQIFAVGLRCVAALFFDARADPVGGVSIAGPAGRLTHELVLKFAPLLLEDAKGLSHELGHAD